jgi:hypothetical protein
MRVLLIFGIASGDVNTPEWWLLLPYSPQTRVAPNQAFG